MKGVGFWKKKGRSGNRKHIFVCLIDSNMCYWAQHKRKKKTLFLYAYDHFQVSTNLGVFSYVSQTEMCMVK